MRILLDHCVPKALASALAGHEVATAYHQGWDALQNGALLSAAEEVGFDVLLTTDRGFKHQQNMEGRQIAVQVVEIHPNTRDRLLGIAPEILIELGQIRPGTIGVLTK